ncbi:MAG: ATP-dependent DNA helicase RecG [Thermoleophilia bacterium]|nr:ATP-dependent DNA helicase RecG [Thermoleophilia bacterium]
MPHAELPRPFAGADAPGGRGPHPPRPERLDAPVRSLPGIGPKLAASLGALGVETVRDLLGYRPRRYEPPAPPGRLADLLAGQEATVDVEVVHAGVRPTRRRRLTILEARVRDPSGSVTAIWFNQAWLADRLRPGLRIRLRGALERGELVVRDFDLGGDGRLTYPAPLYRASEAVSSRRLRELIARALPHLRDAADPLPSGLRAALGLPLRADSLWALHRPRSIQEAEAGRRRLAFEELLVLQLGLARRRQRAAGAVAPALGPPGELASRYREALPFGLTDAQERAIAGIDADLARAVPMERLLQGDVGSGKTVVALYALLRAVERGHQGALMVPTETLAEQHLLTVEPICERLGVRCRLVTSGLPARERRAALAAIAAGDADLAIGTHALIQETVSFRSLAVAVVDEQHRFGVEQRAALAGERAPHRLHMTATPIPRTLAFTVYGDLAVSEIDRPPAGRSPVITRWVTHERASEAYTRLRAHLERGRQAYVVCPLVSPSEASVARAAEAEAERLRGAELAGLRVGCLHGQLRPGERRRIMEEFASGALDVLVATTVIEVGIDVPNATIMIVQEADRFGLAQLHQLRGRVGRGEEQSYCLLVSRPKEELTDVACERLQALVDTTDGFELAETDLELRGMGQLLGTRQSGLSDLRFTRLRQDRPLLERARRCAGELVDVEGPLDDEVERVFGDEDHRGLA